MIHSTLIPAKTGLCTLPRLTERELAGVKDAIESGELVAIAHTWANTFTGAEIVALATPEMAERLTRDHEREVLDELACELSAALEELRNLREIAREVVIERVPADHLYKLERACDDVEGAIKGASEQTATLRENIQ